MVANAVTGHVDGVTQGCAVGSFVQQVNDL